MLIDFTGIEGFDWDAGNVHKSRDKHDVGRQETEQVFFNRPLLLTPDLRHGQEEARFSALGQTDVGRRLHITFTLGGGSRLIRAISARDMNRRERQRYAEEA